MSRQKAESSPRACFDDEPVPGLGTLYCLWSNTDGMDR
jgi:hypothetical protein